MRSKIFAGLLVGFITVICVAPSLGQKSDFPKLLEKAKTGDVDAQNEIGIAYSEGHGIKADQKGAVYWFRRSAENGYAIGACNLALHYARGWGVRKDTVLMMKYVFAAHALDGLKCNPADFIYFIKPRPSECQVSIAWSSALGWLRKHPDFKNDFGDRPWLDDKAEYPVTARENAPSLNLPLDMKCKPKRRGKHRPRHSNSPA